jgi:integrase
MDKQQIAGVLRLLVEQIDDNAPARPRSLTEEIDEYEREKVIPGRVKWRTIAKVRRACDMLREELGDEVLDANFEALAARLVADRGKSALPYLDTLRSILLRAQRAGRRRAPHGLGDLIKRCKYLPRDTVLTEAELARFLAALDELDRTRPLVTPAREVLRVLAYTGARLMEIAALRFEEVGPGFLKLRDSKTGPRKIPLSGPAQLVIGRQRVRDGWAYRVAAALSGLGGSPITLRHTFITLAVRNNVPPEALRRIVGHASTSWIHRNYVHLSKADDALACAVVANAIANAGAR